MMQQPYPTKSAQSSRTSERRLFPVGMLASSQLPDSWGHDEGRDKIVPLVSQTLLG